MSGFECFDSQHILWLFILIITGAVAVRYFPARGRIVGAVLAVLGRVLPGLYEIGKGAYGLSSLPLHVCAMAGYGCFVHWVMSRGVSTGLVPGSARQSCQREPSPVTPHLASSQSCQREPSPMTSVLSELLFFPGLPGAVLALLFPGWGYLPAFSFLSACEFLGHFGIVLYVITSIREKTMRPSRRRALIPVCFCGLYFGIMLPFDLATGMNYGFLLEPAPGSPLAWAAGVAGGGFGYYALYALMVLGAMGVCYALV